MLLRALSPSPKILLRTFFLSKDPGQLPARRAYSSERGVICVITFTTVFRCQVAGVGCQDKERRQEGCGGN